MPSAYQSRPYDDRYSSARMSDLMREAGAVQAQGIQQRGQNTAATIGRMADLVGGAITAGVQAHRQSKVDAEAETAKAEQQRIGEAVKSAIDPATGRLDFTAAAKAIGQIDPLKAEAFWAKADEQQRKAAEQEADNMEEVAKGLGTVLLTAQQDASKATVAYATWRADALKRKLVEPDDFPEQYDAGVVQQQALFKYLPAAEVFKQLFSAKGAPQRSTKVVDGKLVDDQTGQVIYEGESKPPARSTKVVDGRLVDDQTGKVIYTSPDAGRSGGSGRPDTRSATALQDDIAAAEKWKISELNRVEAAYKVGDLSLEDLYAQKDKIQHSYLVQIGAPESTQRMQAEQRRAEMDTMRGLVNPPQNAAAPPAGPPRTPTAPLGAAPAAAAPANRPAPEIERALKAEGPGEYDLADGSTWRVYPDGRMERVK